MDMLGGSPQSDCYLTREVYTVLARFRSGFRLCSAAIPDLRGSSIGRLEGEQAKRDTFLQGFGVARFGVPIPAWSEVSDALLPAGDGGPRSAVQRPQDPRNDDRRRSPFWAVASARKARYLKSRARSDAKPACAARALRRPKLQRWR